MQVSHSTKARIMGRLGPPLEYAVPMSRSDRVARAADTPGIHAPVVELADGRLMTIGRPHPPNQADVFGGKAPLSFSSDQGESWTYAASEFPAVTSVQRPVMTRLKEGPILLCSYTDQWSEFYKGNRKGLVFKSKDSEFTGYGLFAAVSYDEGKTWPDRRLITPGGPAPRSEHHQPRHLHAQRHDGRTAGLPRYHADPRPPHSTPHQQEPLRLQPRVAQTTAVRAEAMNHSTTMKPIRLFLIPLILSVASVCSLGQTAEPVTNSIGMKLVRIEPGTFTMGQDGPPMEDYLRQKRFGEMHKDFDRIDFDEKPAHKVTITQPLHDGCHRGHGGAVSAVRSSSSK